MKKPKKNLTELSDARLVQQWKAGETQAADVIFDRYCMRMVALISKRLSSRWKHQIDPEDVVQSALGSFFHRVGDSRLEFSQSVSLWNLLATFAKRKMLRAIEKRSAAKRGGDRHHFPLDETDLEHIVSASKTSEKENLRAIELDIIESKILQEIPEDSLRILQLMLQGSSQTEIATALQVTDRTIRRRTEKLRQQLAGKTTTQPSESVTPFASSVLPRIHYGDFVLGRFVDAGNFGKVYRASLRVDGKIVAVKFLRKEFWKHVPARQSFLREIEQVSQVRHISVLRYLGWGESPHGGPYIVSQWQAGMSLEETHRNHPLNADQFLDRLLKIAEGLEAVHSAGVVHGDLTPRNIICNEKGNVTIVDFGFAMTPATVDQSLEASPPKPLGGTLGWAAPEQVSAAFGSISPRTDVWAIGALAFWFLTGEAPLQRPNWEAMLVATLATNPVNCDGLKAESPHAVRLRSIADRALKDFADRPATIGELLSS